MIFFRTTDTADTTNTKIWKPGLNISAKLYSRNLLLKEQNGYKMHRLVRWRFNVYLYEKWFIPWLPLFPLEFPCVTVLVFILTQLSSCLLFFQVLFFFVKWGVGLKTNINSALKS